MVNTKTLSSVLLFILLFPMPVQAPTSQPMPVSAPPGATPSGLTPAVSTSVGSTSAVSPPAVPPPAVSEQDVDLLARLIQAEAGASWMPDELQLMVGNVVLNRVDSPEFPDTLREVIYQPGQYSPAMSGSIDRPARDRATQNARKLLEGYRLLPPDVVFQANFKQGSGVYHSVYDEYLGSTTYFCYSNNRKTIVK